jgi:hypothetical protein
MKSYLVPALAAAVLMTGCAAGADSARDPGGDGTPESANPSKPTANPTAAPWPAYVPDDYTYTLRVACYCPDAGVPGIVTVADGKVVDAVFARNRFGQPAGAPAPEFMRVTIDDIINAANDPKADTVTVRWPKGRDHPSWVWIDQMTNAVDEEVGYTIRHVDPA